MIVPSYPPVTGHRQVRRSEAEALAEDFGLTYIEITGDINAYNSAGQNMDPNTYNVTGELLREILGRICDIKLRGINCT